MDSVDLTGAVDLHTHVGPSPFDRRVDAYECAVEAARAGMDAVVFKEHHLPTVYGIAFVKRLLERDGLDVTPVGSVVCNYVNGGFNPFVVESALTYGAGVVWGPTLDARHHAEATGELGAFLGVEAGEEYEGRAGIAATDDDGALREEVRLCVRKVADHDAVLALGHLSFAETRAVVEYAADLGHRRVVVDHPNYPVTDLDHDQQRTLVDLGATMNLPYLAIDPEHGWTDPATLADNVRAVGAENCVLSSDVGQRSSPPVPESLRTLCGALVDEGLPAGTVERMVRAGPRRLLGLD